MSCYADTGFLVSLHSWDANTGTAKQRMRRHGSPFVWTWLHAMAFRNVIRLQVFRNQISANYLNDILRNQSQGLESGVYFFSQPCFEEVRSEVERLSAAYTQRLGARTLDVLHVAQAIVLGIREFLTFDSRQANVAREAGLDVPELLG